MPRGVAVVPPFAIGLSTAPRRAILHVTRCRRRTWEVVKAAAEAFDRGDLDIWIEFFDPEIEWHDLPTLP
jgi:hypothetical protein